MDSGQDRDPSNETVATLVVAGMLAKGIVVDCSFLVCPWLGAGFFEGRGDVSFEKKADLTRPNSNDHGETNERAHLHTGIFVGHCT